MGATLGIKDESRASAEVMTGLVDGASAEALIHDALARFPAEISYVRAEVGQRFPLLGIGATPSDGEWISCGDLIADPGWLAAIIRQTGHVLGTDDPVVAASLFVQNYSYRVLMVAIACLTTSGIVPSSDASAMAITLSKGRPYRIGYAAPSALALARKGRLPAELLDDPVIADRALRFIVTSAVDSNLSLLIEATRMRFRVGARLCWGNVAASAAVAFRTMDGCAGTWVRFLGERFFETGPEVLRGLGAFYSLEQEGRSGWFWERTNCCLYDRLPGNIRCADCSRTPVSERRAAYLLSLSER